MTQYTYLLVDTLTNVIHLELPLYGVYFDRKLNGVGNATFSFILGNEKFNDQDIIDYTIPVKYSLWILRDNAVIWAGIIWSRTYQAQSTSLQYTAQTFESYFYKQIIETNYNTTNTDQRQILKDLVIAMQAKPSANIGIVLPASFDSLTAVPRTENFWNYENWSYGKAINYLIEYKDGFDYTIDVGFDSNNNLTKTLRTDNKLGQPASTTQLAFDYPGNIKNFWMPESGTESASTVLGFGAGESTGILKSKYVNQPLLDGGYPDIQVSISNADVSIQTTLDSQVEAEANRLYIPKIVPTFEINPEIEPVFGSYSLGDYARIAIKDLRFPEGKDFSTRIIGWTCSPPSQDSGEQVKLVVLGEENA